MAELAHQPDVAPPRWRAYVPGVSLIKSYQRKWLPKDIVAGLVLSALAGAAGDGVRRPGRTAAGDRALHLDPLPASAYAVFGPSRVLVLGPDSVPGSDDRGDHRPSHAGAAVILRGRSRWPRYCADASSASIDGRRRAGQVRVRGGPAVQADADRLHERARRLTIIVGQLPKLLGFSVDADGLVAEARAFASGLARGRGERDGRRPRRRLSRRHPAA